nr:immunoglobulin light chain junction region [Macaca mulatta]
ESFCQIWDATCGHPIF